MSDGLTPHSYLYRFSDPVSGAPVWRSQSGEWNGQKPQAFVGMYTGDQVEAALATQADALAKVTAERDAAREALTPSGHTKAAYHGEFSFQLFRGVSDAGIDQYEKVYVPWDTVKEIMAAITARALAETQP